MPRSSDSVNLFVNNILMGTTSSRMKHFHAASVVGQRQGWSIQTVCGDGRSLLLAVVLLLADGPLLAGTPLRIKRMDPSLQRRTHRYNVKKKNNIERKTNTKFGGILPGLNLGGILKSKDSKSENRGDDPGSSQEVSLTIRCKLDVMIKKRQKFYG